jgi:hypothetical protein
MLLTTKCLFCLGDESHVVNLLKTVSHSILSALVSTWWPSKKSMYLPCEEVSKQHLETHQKGVTCSDLSAFRISWAFPSADQFQLSRILTEASVQGDWHEY